MCHPKMAQPFCLFFLSLSALAFGLELQLEPAELKDKKTGENIMVQCRIPQATEDDGISIRWVRRQDGMDSDIPSTGRVLVQDRGVPGALGLLILDAKQEDAGDYVCMASLNEDRGESSVTLNLYKSIEFLDCKKEQHPISGSAAELICRVDGDPTPSVVWRKDNDIISPAGARGHQLLENDNILLIPDYDPAKDDGEYKVQVVQTAYGALDFRSIDVSAFVEPAIVDWDNWTEGYEGQNLDLSCSATGKPAPSFGWFKGDEQLEKPDKFSVSEEGTLTIQRLSPDDGGVYRCQAENTVGSKSQERTVSVYLQPRIEPMPNRTVRKGDNEELRCEFSGSGNMDSWWMFRGQSISADAADIDVDTQPITEEFGQRIFATLEKIDDKKQALVLHIANVDLSNADEYQCEVKNMAGDDLKRMFLSVTHAPRLFKRTDKAVRSSGGQTAELFCEVSAVPSPTWAWEHNRETVVADDEKIFIQQSEDGLRSTLKIVTSAEEDYGKYLCRADNAVGTEVVVEMSIIEIEPPPVPELLLVKEFHPNFANISIEGFEDLPEAVRPLQVSFYVAREEDVIANPDFNFVQDVPPATFAFKPENYYIIPNLTPKTVYEVRALAENEADRSELTPIPFTYTTTEPKEPMAPAFVAPSGAEECDNSCKVSWTHPNNRGADIETYHLSYVEVESMEDGESVAPIGIPQTVDDIPSHETSYLLEGLAPNALYEVQLVAQNSVGQGEPATLIIRTYDYPVLSGGVSTGLIVLIVIIILLVVLILVDLSCYYVNHCGILMSICVRCCGKTPPDVKAKEIALEEGKKSDDKTPLKEKEPEDKADETNETTRMIEAEKEKKNTTV